MRSTDHQISCGVMMASVLEDILLTQQNELIMTTPQTRPRNYSPFRSEFRLKASLREYVDRLASYLHISDTCFIVALIYIDRLVEADASLQINHYSIHKLWAISVVLAMKYNEDLVTYKTKFLSQVLGIGVQELCFLEFKFMELIGFNLFIQLTEFQQYWEYLLTKYLDVDQIETDDKEVIKQAIGKMYINMGLCSCHHPSHTVERPVTGVPEKERKKRRVKKSIKKKAFKKVSFLAPWRSFPFS